MTQMRSFARTSKSFVAVVAVALLATSAANAAEWLIASVDGVATEGDARIAFNRDGTFGGSTGCNRFQGSGTFEDGQLVIDAPVATTKMACPGNALTRQDDTIVALFDGAIDVDFDPFGDRMTFSRIGTAVALDLAGDAYAPDTGPHQPSEPEQISLSSAAFVNVFGLSGHLNIHAEPNVSSRVVGKASAGILFRSNGCEQGQAHDWCNVVFLDASGVQGWAAAEYLEPATADIRAGEGIFDQIGKLSCAETEDDPQTECDFGIARDPNGTAVVSVFRPDGFQRFLTFRNGAFAFTDSSQAGGGFDAAGSHQGDRTIVVIDGERYDVPDSLLSTE